MYITVIKAIYHSSDRKLELFDENAGLYDVVDKILGQRGEPSNFIIVRDGFYRGVMIHDLTIMV